MLEKTLTFFITYRYIVLFFTIESFLMCRYVYLCKEYNFPLLADIIDANLFELCNKDS